MNTLKFIAIKKVALFSLGALIIASCASPSKLSKSLDKMNFKPETEVLEVNGDSIRIVVRGKIPPKTFHKKAIVKFQPLLRYGDDLTEEKELKALYLQGEGVKKEKKKDGSADKAETKVIKYAKGGSFTYKETMEFSTIFKKSKLGMDYQVKIASSYNELDQCITGKRDSALRGTITTSLLVKPMDDVYFYVANDKVNNDLDKDLIGDMGKGGNLSKKDVNVPDVVFYHVLDETILRDSVNKGAPNRKLQSILNEISTKNAQAKKDKTKPSVKVNKLVIKSYASPDGEFRHNKDLCKGRSNSGFNWVKKEMKRYNIKDVYDKDLVKMPDDKAEDWDGFKKAVETSNFSGKAEILAIINSNQDVESKEKAFRASSAWPELKDNILPKLRRTEIYFQAEGLSGNKQTVKQGPKTLAEIKSIYKGEAEGNLTQKEMFTLAASTEDMKEKEKIYKSYTEKYPSDPIGKSNYAAAVLKNATQEVFDYRTAMSSTPAIDEAHNVLEQLSAQYPANDTIKNNLAVAKRFKRRYSEAAEIYVSAKGKGVYEGNNLGIISIKTGNYADAVSNFKPDQCDYNVCLAYTLNKEYDKALEKINCTRDAGKGNADLMYLKAIVHARQGNKSDMASALKQCLSLADKDGKGADFRDQLSKDLEFVKFADTPEYKEAVK